MKVWAPLVAVVVLALLAFGIARGPGMQTLFGTVIPYAALAVFLLGMLWRVARWAKSPVPFRIPTTAVQQASLPWLKRSRLESPFTALEVAGRMALEILFFRSLFRNTKAEVRDGKLGYGSAKWLWLAGLVFHWSMLVIVLRHLRLFLAPVPGFVGLLEAVDGLFQVGVPVLYITNALFALSVTYLFLRRVVLPQVAYISQAADYFALFLLLGIGATGVLMRYFFHVDILKVKQLTIGLVLFKPSIPAGIGPLFFAHLFLVCALFVYLPFSKLVHLGGVFLSPTRNLANNNRAVRHVNPWDYPVHVHTYDEYEDEFREKMKAVGLPVEKETP
jgi:nitrate reductase gamma subunit